MNARDYMSYFLHNILRMPFTLNAVEFRSPKRPRATFVLLHGIGNSSHAWDDVVKKMPKDVRIIGVDLLGFGNSPKPRWAMYDAKTQARSVGLTILGLRLAQQPIVVGHSLGALVAVKVAKRYPLAIRRLVLCSPPFYKPIKDTSKLADKHWQDEALRTLYRVATKNPDKLKKFSPMAVKLGLANKVLVIDDENVESYVSALEASIINQRSLEDIARLNLPIDIFYGQFDPVVVKKHIVNLQKTKKNVSATQLLAAHEITGKYLDVLAEHLKQAINKS